MKNSANYCQHFLLILAFIFSINAQDRIFPSDRAQVEAPIAINPTNPQNLVGAAITIKDNNKQIGYYYSFNGGDTWNGSENTLGNDGADPVVTFDPDGTAYLLYQKRSEGKLLLHKSTGGGMNWSDPPITVVDLNTAIKNVDRPWMAFSPIRNQNTQKFNLYISYTLEDVNNNSYSIALHRSRDGGENFELIEEISPGANHILQGSYVAVDPEGKVYLAWAELKFSDSAVEKIHVNLYANEGSTLESSHARATQQIGEPGANKQFFVKTGKVRADSYPRIAVDHSLNAGTRGRAYIVWAGKLSEIFDAEILMIRRKKDTSGNWIWDDGTVHIDEYLQWQPAPGVSPDGVLSVLFYNSESNAHDDPITAYLRKSFDGGETFSANILNNPGFTLFSGAAPFQPLLGDYHGLTSWRGKVYGLWSEHHTDHAPDDPIQLYFRAFDVNEIPPPANYFKVIVDQLDGGSQSFGKVGRWNQGTFTNYTTPYEFVFEEMTDEFLRADQEFKPGTTQKYNHWQINNVFDNIINHGFFTVVNNQPPISASFKTAHNATIQTELISANQMNLGYVEFKDPWLIDFEEPPYGWRNRGMEDALLKPYALPLELTTADPVFMGVFLDQGFPFYDPPYYTVAAPVQLVDGVTYFLSGWSASPAGSAQFQNASAETTAAIFRQPNAVVTANMKGHLASNCATATAYNNSRKVAVDHIGGWHAVYEDNGQIYYIHSTDNGSTWEPEELVSGRFGNVNRYPAITIEPVSPFHVSVVWDMEMSGTHYFNGRTKPLSGAWEDEFSAYESGLFWGISTPTKPVVLRRGDLYILTKSLGVLELYRFNGEELEWLGVIPGSDESSENPAMTASPYYPSGVLHFAWEQRNQIYFSYFLPPSTFGAAEEVTVPKADIEFNRQPSISYSYAATNQINVAWSGFDTDLNAYVLLHRQRSSNLYGQWGSLNEVYYSYSNLSHPSIGSFDVPFPG